MELNRNPENYFAEIEQAAFSPSNIVPGIGFSPDKMLQARIFSYADAHRYRLGTHYEALPVNAPKCPVHHYHKDGPMRFFPNDTGNPDAYYEPNSFGGPAEAPDMRRAAAQDLGRRGPLQPPRRQRRLRPGTALFNLFDAGQKQRLFNNIAEAMGGVPAEIVERQCQHFDKVHKDYGAGVRKAVAALSAKSKAAE